MKTRLLLFFLLLLPLFLSANRTTAWQLTKCIGEFFDWGTSTWNACDSTHYVYPNEHVTNPDYSIMTIVAPVMPPVVTTKETNYTWDATHQHLLTMVETITPPTHEPCSKTYQYNTQMWVTHVAEVYNYDNPVYNQIFHTDYLYGTGMQYVEIRKVVSTTGISFQKTTHEYDSRGRIITKTQYQSSDSLNWNPDYKWVYEYDVRDASVASDFLPNPYQPWIPKNELRAFDNPNIKLSNYKEFHYYEEANDWQENYRYIYFYNIAGNISSINRYSVFGTEISLNANDLLYYNYENNQSQFVYGTWFPDAEQIISYYGQRLMWQQIVAIDDHTTSPALALNLKSYPNPFQNTMSVQLTSRSPETATLDLFNLKGQKVQHVTMQPNTELKLDNSNLPSGIYFLKATQHGKFLIHKVIKLK